MIRSQAPWQCPRSIEGAAGVQLRDYMAVGGGTGGELARVLSARECALESLA